MFLKEKLEDQGKIDPLGASHLIFVSHYGQRFDIPFLMTALRKNVEAKFFRPYIYFPIVDPIR